MKNEVDALHQFDRDRRLEKTGSGEFVTRLSEDWSINGTPNGGYVLALVASAMRQLTGKQQTPIVTANYIARCVPGPAEIKIERVSRSSTMVRMAAQLCQDGVEKVRVFGTFFSGLLHDGYVEYDGGPPAIVSKENAVKVPTMGKNSLFKSLDLRLDPACSGWVVGQYALPMEFKGWVGFSEPRSVDIDSILLFSDAFPPPVFVAHGAKAWVPTLELTVNIRQIPAPGMLLGIFRSRYISGGLVEEDGQLWDVTGQLIALSRQYALYTPKKVKPANFESTGFTFERQNK